jgi:iron complex transport system substrate-binding protein
MEERLAALDARVAKTGERPRVFFEVRSPNMLAAGESGMVAEIIRRAGGTNCVAERGGFARLSEEEIVRLAPEAYLIQRGPMNPAPLPLAGRPRLRTIPAAQSGRAWFVDEQKYSRPGPQSVDAAEELAALLHPELNMPAKAGPNRNGKAKGKK